MNQKDMILDYMHQHGGITQLEAGNDLGVQRLGARIWELKHKLGYTILSERITVKNRRGEKCSVVRYKLEG